MSGNMADLALLIVCVAFILTLLTTCVGTLVLPFLSTSRQDVKDLFLIIKDLTLPLGSFPSRLLEPRTSAVLYQVIPEGFSKGADSRLIPIPTSSCIESIPTGSKCIDSEEYSDKLSFDAFKHPPDQSYGAETVILDAAGGPVLDVVEGATEALSKVKQATGNEPADSNRTDEEQAAQITPSSVTADSTDGNPERVAAHLSEMLEEKEMLEAYIRQVADPEGSRGLAAMGLGPLIRWMMQGYERITNGLRTEKNRVEDELYNAKQAFEAIIIGQNVAMKEMDHERGLAREEASELVLETSGLRKSSEKAKKDFEGRIEELSRRVKTAQEVAQEARETAAEATAGVESRIKELKTAHAKELTAAALQSFQERNTIICSRRMVEDNLRDARHQVTMSEQQHKAAMKDQNSTIDGLKAMVRQLRSTVATSEERVALTKQMAEEQLNDQRKEKDQEVSTLKGQLRESNEKVKALDGWKGKAEAEQRNSQRLWDRLKDETTTLRENREHIVGNLKRDVASLERTIKMKDAKIAKLGRKIVSLESGQEVKHLKSQLEEAQKQWQQSTNEMQGLRTQLQTLEQEKAGLKRTIDDKDREIQRKSEAWTTEKGALEQDLKQAKIASNRNIQGKVGKLEEEKQGLLRELRAAQSNEQGVRAQMQNLEGEKVRTAEQHQNMINEKDQKIRNLEQMTVNTNTRFEPQVQEEVGRRLKVAVDAKEVEVRETANREYEKKKIDHEREKDKAVRDAVENANKNNQSQLDSERRTCLEKMNEATKTENDLRAEIEVLKSQAEGYTNAAGSLSTTKADSEPGDNTEESTSLTRELDETLDLFEEIEERGILRICGERILLRELNEAKRAMSLVKREVQQPEPDKSDLLYAISEASIDEGRFHQCDPRKRPVLIRQARAANERLESLRDILSTNLEVQKDAVLEILQSPARNEIGASADQHGPQGRSVDSATARARQGEGDFNMGEASEMQGTGMSETSETRKLGRELADFCATLLRKPPVTPGQAAERDQPPQAETGANGQGFAFPRYDSSAGLPPLPGLFQPQSVDQAPIPGSFPLQGAKKLSQPVFIQPPGEIKMPRGLTKSMRQWAKGWVRNGDIEQAGTLLLAKFPLLKAIVVKGLRSYLVELKQQVQGQPLDQMEQPGGWTDDMTTLVEAHLQDGTDPNTITKIIEMGKSYPADMKDADMYVQKLKQEYDSNPEKRVQQAQKPAGWTDDMTGTVMDALGADIDTGFECLEELLKGMNDFVTNDTEGLQRYLEKLRREVQAQKVPRTPCIPFRPFGVA